MNTSSLRLVACSIFAALAMGISMPSCPGQQAMQQQIDSLKTENLGFKRQLKDLETKLQGLDSLNNEFGQAKALLSQMTDTIKEQQNALAQMDATVKELAARPVPKPAAAPRPATRTSTPLKRTAPRR